MLNTLLVGYISTDIRQGSVNKVEAHYVHIKTRETEDLMNVKCIDGLQNYFQIICINLQSVENTRFFYSLLLIFLKIQFLKNLMHSCIY